MAYTKDNNGVSALHLAAKKGCIAVLKTFSKLCPDSCELSDLRDRTALHFAVANHQAYAVRKMLELGSFQNLVNQQDIGGNTPLHVAAIAGDFVIVMMLAANGRVNKKIMNKAGFTTNDVIRLSPKFSWYEKVLFIYTFNQGINLRVTINYVIYTVFVCCLNNCFIYHCLNFQNFYFN